MEYLQTERPITLSLQKKTVLSKFYKSLFTLAILFPIYSNSFAKNEISLCTAQIKGKIYSCILGRSGVTPSSEKREGDDATPAGTFSLYKEVFYRPDRIKPEQIQTKFAKTAIQKDDGWCDDPKNKDYNRHVKLPFKYGHEKLWFEGENPAYNLILPINYNFDSPVPSKGSAIFIHLVRKDENGNIKPTAGCIAFEQKDLLEILKSIGPNTKVRITKNNQVFFE